MRSLRVQSHDPVPPSSDPRRVSTGPPVVPSATVFRRVPRRFDVSGGTSDGEIRRCKTGDPGFDVHGRAWGYYGNKEEEDERVDDTVLD